MRIDDTCGCAAAERVWKALAVMLQRDDWGWGTQGHTSADLPVKARNVWTAVRKTEKEKEREREGESQTENERNRNAGWKGTSDSVVLRDVIYCLERRTSIHPTFFCIGFPTSLSFPLSKCFLGSLSLSAWHHRVLSQRSLFLHDSSLIDPPHCPQEGLSVRDHIVKSAMGI